MNIVVANVNNQMKLGVICEPMLFENCMKVSPSIFHALTSIINFNLEHLFEIF